MEIASSFLTPQCRIWVTSGHPAWLAIGAELVEQLPLIPILPPDHLRILSAAPLSARNTVRSAPQPRFRRRQSFPDHGSMSQAGG
jgi:hypothetical protein